MYEILWFHAAVDQLFEISRTDPRQALRILTAVRSFGRDGKGDVKKLQGSSVEWRIRTGDWRLRAAKHGAAFHTVSVDNRRDAY